MFVLPGAPALSSRGLKESDFVKVVEYLDEATNIALEAKSQTSTSRGS